MGQWYTYSKSPEICIALVIQLYGVSAIFLIFYDHQDSESEPQEMEIGVVGPISTQKKHQRIYRKMITILYKMGEKNYVNY